MGKIIKDTLHANGIDIGIYTQDFENEFISLTDIARYKSDDPTAVIQNWMRNRNVIEFLGLWERLHNSEFKPLEFEGFRKQAGANAFTMSPKKWIDATSAIGIVSKSGRYGGTYAHSDIAMSFATWISPEFQLYIMKDYRRLKADENSRLSLNWNLNREISKLNYKIHTDACFLQALFGENCKIFLENVASPNWRILQSLAGSYSASRIAIADSI